MNTQLSLLVEESIKLELNVANLYKYFSVIFPEDTDFWQKLSAEEEKHARLIKTGKDVLLSYDEFPSELLSPTLQDLNEANNNLNSLQKEFNAKPPSRKTALNIAISLEESAGEIHFQRAMDMSPTSGYMKIFQDLNKEDMDHARRIREYMNTLGIL